MINSFTKEFFINNRERFAKSIPDCLVLIPANLMLQKSADEPFKFRQDSSFWFFTGLNEPDLVLVIDTTKNSSTLLLPEQNQYQREWDGELNKAQLKKVSGISKFASLANLQKILKDAKTKGLQISQLAPMPERVEPYGFMSNPARKLLENEIKQIELKPKDVRLEVAKVRQIKQQVEIDLIQRAIDITGDSLKQLKENIDDYKNENELERALLIKFLENGADGHMFDPIIASGKNSATIHYKQNSAPIKMNQLILLDVGAKIGMYGADISRTWSVGEPTKRQRDIFEAVLAVHKNSISRFKPGLTLKEEQEQVNRDLSKLYKKLKISDRQLPNGISHFLGVDTHDAGDYRSPLEVGSVLTVEPGIYLPDEGIGIRIEDNLLITKDGAKILSENIDQNL